MQNAYIFISRHIKVMFKQFHHKKKFTLLKNELKDLMNYRFIEALRVNTLMLIANV